MHPILFEIGNWPVYSYGVLLAVAYLVGPAARGGARATRRPRRAPSVMDLGIYLIIAALVGAKLMLIVVDFDYFREQPRELLSLVRAGGVFYGGLIAALVVGAAGSCAATSCRCGRRPTCSRPGIALGHVIGRLGCLLAGCCYGRPTRPAVGHHVHRPGRGGERRHAARRAAASDAALRRRRRAAHPRRSCW